MVKASVLICTARQDPQLKLTLECLKNQTFKDFELLYVDALKSERPKEFLDLIDSYRQYFPIVHLRDKPKPPECVSGISNARNTGIIFASGETIIMTGDETYVQNFWVERHVLAYDNSYNSSAPTLVLKKEDVKEDLNQFLTGEIIKHPTEHPIRMLVKFGSNTYDSPSDCRIPGLPDELVFGKNCYFLCPGGWMHSLNLQMSLDRLLNVNGFDERYDKTGYGFEDTDLGFRMAFMGFPQILDTGNWVSQINGKPLIQKEGIGVKNKELYDERSKNVIPIWSNSEFNLRKMREEIRKRL